MIGHPYGILFHRLISRWFILLGQLILLQHRSESFVAEDQVVEHPDTEQLARLQQPLRDIDIVIAGNEYATGVVVGYNHCGGPFPERIAEYLPLNADGDTLSTTISKKKTNLLLGSVSPCNRSSVCMKIPSVSIDYVYCSTILEMTAPILEKSSMCLITFPSFKKISDGLCVYSRRHAIRSDL